MDLKTFIAETIASLVDGVVEAQKRVEAAGAHVNPGGLMRTTKSIGKNSLWDNQTNNFARNVSFDVAITVEGGAKTEAKIGVLGGIIGASAGGQSDSRNLAVSRVSFVIPLLLPTTTVKGARVKKVT